jgi:hypothetical protein
MLASAALAGAALAACGGSGSGPPANNPHTTSAADAGFTGTIAAGATQVCMPKSAPVTAGDPPPGTCVIELGSGGRYQCPMSVAQSFGADGSDAATNSACKKVAPPRIPASWRPTLRRLAAVKACLKRAGIASGGGSLAGFESHRDTPIGGLLMAGPTRPTSIAFYASDAKASQAYAGVRANVANEGGTIIRHGQLLINWGSLPIAKVHASEERCALHP